MGIKDSDIDPDDYASIDSFSSVGGGGGSEETGSEDDDFDSGVTTYAFGCGLDDVDSITDSFIEARELAGYTVGSRSTYRSAINDVLPAEAVCTGKHGTALIGGTERDQTRAKLLNMVQGREGRKIVVLTDWLVYCEDDLGSLSSFLTALLDAECAVTASGSDVILSPGHSLDGGEVVGLLGELSTATLDPRDHQDIEVLRRDWSGRTPIGTEVSMHGNLVPSQDFERVRSHLLDVIEGGESRTWASNRIGCSLRTVSRILDDPDRRELYRLPVVSE